MAARLLYAQFAIVICITALHLVSLENDLYWRFIWLDTATHALGGIWVALAFFWARALLGYEQKFIWGVFGALLLGIAWEIFEVWAGVEVAKNYQLDTSIDLLMDVIGGALGALLALRIIRSAGTREVL